jgi:hypothetical protein
MLKKQHAFFNIEMPMDRGIEIRRAATEFHE